MVRAKKLEPVLTGGIIIMSRSIKHLWLLGLMMSLIAMCALTACTTTTPNTTETTAPTLTWKVLNRDTNNTQTYTGNASMTITLGTTYTVTLITNDPGGVHQITLGSSSGWTCIDGNIASSSGPSLDKTDVQNLNPDSNNQVLTSIFLIRNASVDPNSCQSGYTLSSANESLYGTSTNFANHKAQATLTLNL
jgi:hypothetical protein